MSTRTILPEERLGVDQTEGRYAEHKEGGHRSRTSGEVPIADEKFEESIGTSFLNTGGSPLILPS